MHNYEVRCDVSRKSFTTVVGVDLAFKHDESRTEFFRMKNKERRDSVTSQQLRHKKCGRRY